MKTKKIFNIIKALAIFGILLSTYLLWQQFFTPTFKPCSISAKVNCDAIITGPVAKTFGIPTPLFGCLGYIIILFTAIKKMQKTMFLVTLGGLLFCTYIAYIELVILKVICPICIMCQVTILSVFALQIYLSIMKGQKCVCSCCVNCDCKECKCECGSCECKKN